MESKFHALMFPWFAFGHMTPFLHLANKLAEKGHKITYLLPKKAQEQLQHQNSFPDKIIFHTVTVPSVDGLPDGAETASDIPVSSGTFLASATDRMRHQVENTVRIVKPNVIFFDFSYWIPEIGKEFGIKTVNFVIISAATIARSLHPGGNVEDLSLPAPGYPSSKVLLHEHETNSLDFASLPFGDKITFFERITTGLINCDIILLRTCHELEGKYCDFIEKQYQKKVLLVGPILPELDKTIPLEDQWKNWLGQFEPRSVIYCGFGTQIILEKDQFQELCLGIEETGLPFLIAVKPPKDVSTIDEALPEGFKERVGTRGVVCGEWVQQPLILSHISVGCFVSHCGFGSMWESIVSDCQIVLVPHLGDQIINTRLMSEELEISVEVKRDERGMFSKESLRDAINSVMEKESEVGKKIRRNHVKWKETLGSDGLMSSYVDNFVDALQKQI